MKEPTFEERYYRLFDAAGKVKNYTKAFPLLMVAAKNGHPHAQNVSKGFFIEANSRCSLR